MLAEPFVGDDILSYRKDQMLNISELKKYYSGKKVLMTGHTGFKGSYMCVLLKFLGAKVYGYSLKPEKGSLYELLKKGERKLVAGETFADIRDIKKLTAFVKKVKPDYILHMAAQPLVLRGYKEPRYTYEVNVMGTVNLMEAIRQTFSGHGILSKINRRREACELVSILNVTTDKVYENNDLSNYAFKEHDKLCGRDPYANSKSCSELVTYAYDKSFFSNKDIFRISTARAGNVIGGGDWALDRLIPDCIRAINSDNDIEIRNPIAVRPWQHVLEPLSGYLLLGQKLFDEGKNYAEGFNFGPNEDSVLTVADVAQKVCENYGKGKVVVGEKSPLHEAGLLMLNIEKAKNVLSWKPTYNADVAISKTVEWYKHFYQKDCDMLDFTLSQIEDFEKAKNQ